MNAILKLFSNFKITQNKRVSEAFVNQKKIDAKVKQLNLNTNQFIKQSQQWIQLLESFNTALKVNTVSVNLSVQMILACNSFVIIMNILNY